MSGTSEGVTGPGIRATPSGNLNGPLGSATNSVPVSGSLDTAGLTNYGTPQSTYAAPEQPSAWSQFSNNLTHGGGNTKLTSDEVMQISNISRSLEDQNLDPAVKEALLAKRSEILNKDNGGYLGALGRMLTGSGQTSGEKVGTGLITAGMGALRNYMAQQALQNSTKNMMNNSANILAAQRQQLGRGQF